MDINEEGEIRFTDFIVAAASRERLLHDKQIEQVLQLGRFLNQEQKFVTATKIRAAKFDNH